VGRPNDQEAHGRVMIMAARLSHLLVATTFPCRDNLQCHRNASRQ
jgi:hypothetical protein